MIVIGVAAGLVIACVLTHVASLRWITRVFLHPMADRRRELLVGVMLTLAILVHLVEIGFFAVATRWLAEAGSYGHLEGDLSSFRDYFYYSAITYTSVGYGDITPVGDLRGLAAVEALAGIVLITWTASVGFLTIQRWWQAPGAAR